VRHETIPIHQKGIDTIRISAQIHDSISRAITIEYSTQCAFSVRPGSHSVVGGKASDNTHSSLYRTCYSATQHTHWLPTASDKKVKRQQQLAHSHREPHQISLHHGRVCRPTFSYRHEQSTVCYLFPWINPNTSKQKTASTIILHILMQLRITI